MEYGYEDILRILPCRFPRNMNIFQALSTKKQITMYSICNSFSVMATASMGGDKTALDAYFDARPNGDRAKLKIQCSSCFW